MIILGMHFGHDGAVSIIKDGKVLYISRERTSRVKHAIGITTNELDLALGEAKITVNDIDYCTLVSTQNMEILNGLIDDFSISFEMRRSQSFFSTSCSFERKYKYLKSFIFSSKDLFSQKN